jgi:hypothetical protein
MIDVLLTAVKQIEAITKPPIQERQAAELERLSLLYQLLQYGVIERKDLFE